MTNWLKSDIGALLKEISFFLLVFFVIRTVFLLVNLQYFAVLNTGEILLSLFYAIKFDLAVLLPFNLPFVLLALLFPVLFEQKRKIIHSVFVILNSFLVLLAVVDNLYFSYTQHRINYASIYIIPGSFTWTLLGTYLLKGSYWVLLLLILGKAYQKLFTSKKIITVATGWKQKAAGAMVAIALSFASVRGFESRPLSPSTALLYFPPRIINLASNTGFNLLYTFYKGQKELPELHFFSEKKLDQKFRILHELRGQKDISRPNIVLFVMESFAHDFLDKDSRFKASTPFLDSLMHESLVFKNAYSNGNESTHGLVSILASLPPFMDIPYYHSQYQAVSIHGIGEMLATQKYDCSFFLGDVDDSFGFTQFTHSLGIEHYYSRKNFGDDRFYNGAWGIHDDRFFKYAAGVLSAKTQPFFAGIYNVSSHPPYIIPDDLKKEFTIAGQNAAQNSVSYVDYAYRQFFKKAKKENWSRNTIFIFIADHFLSPSEDKQVNSVNSNEIPFFIYSPRANYQSDSGMLVQQLDIVPTILDLSGYKGKYMSFGHSVFDTAATRYAVQRMGDIFQIMDKEYVLGFNHSHDQVSYLYNYREDPTLAKNLLRDSVGNYKKSELESALKARMQRYNNGFLHNRLYY